MKKTLLGIAGAAALAACGASTPAYAADAPRAAYEQNYPGYERLIKADHKRHHNRNHNYRYDRNRGNYVIVNPYVYTNPYGYQPYSYYHYNRRYSDNLYYWRYFSRLPSYYPGRCNRYDEIVVRDPYTGRRVCMPRYDYNRFRIILNIRL
jgi:hypothetical protein